MQQLVVKAVESMPILFLQPQTGVSRAIQSYGVFLDGSGGVTLGEVNPEDQNIKTSQNASIDSYAIYHDSSGSF